MFVARRGSRAVSPKQVPEVMAQTWPFLLAMHTAHELLGFWLSDFAQDLAVGRTPRCRTSWRQWQRAA